MNHETTLADTSSEQSRRIEAAPGVLALVVAHCAEQPELMGAVLVPPPGDPGEEVVWGRGGDEGGEGRRAILQRHRPGRVTPAGEVQSSRVSRVHLRLTGQRRAGAERPFVDVTNVGRSPLVCNGEERQAFRAVHGDVLEVGKQIVFVCVERPALIAGPVVDESFAFGEADAHGIVGESPAIWELRRRIGFVGPREGHVFVRGESGSGKELVAQALHAASRRAGRRLVSRNAATLPEGIVDAELFGNQRSYPNPGTPERPGLVGEAEGSTLFLDEIAEIPTPLQAHLLRLMDSGEYHRLGESRARRADLRLVGATNRPGSALKHDLLARFVFRIEVPDLNDRLEDILLLARHLLKRIAAQDPAIKAQFFAEGEPRLSRGLVRGLLRHPFTTHVRELSALLWQALAESTGDRIEAPSGLLQRDPTALERVSDAGRSSSPSALPPAEDVGMRVVDTDGPGLSQAAVQACLDAHNGVIEDAWRPLGLSSRHALTRLIKKLGVEIRKKPR